MAVDKCTSTDPPKKDKEMQYLKQLINLQFDKLERKTKMIAPLLKKRTENYITSYISSLKEKSDFPLVLLRDTVTQTDAPDSEKKALKDAQTQTDTTYYQIIGARSIFKSMIPIPILGASRPPKWTPSPKVKEILELEDMKVKKGAGDSGTPGDAAGKATEDPRFKNVPPFDALPSDGIKDYYWMCPSASCRCSISAAQFWTTFAPGNPPPAAAPLPLLF